MAETLLAFVINGILKNLQSVAAGTISRAWGLRSDLEKLRETTGRLQTLLQNAQDKLVDDDESIKLWVEKLQEVLYSAADVLDEFHYETLRRKVEINEQLRQKVREFVSRDNTIIFRVNMAAKVKKANESLVYIENQVPTVLLGYQMTVVVADRGVGDLDSHSERRTDSYLGNSERPVGRKEEVEKIINMLQVSSTDPPPLTVVSIVGFGGLGKTTLAKLVLKEANEKKLFDKTIWVCVSETFDDEKILGAMLEIIDENNIKPSTIEAILGRLQNGLEHKRFLLVLDDVWNDKSEKCNNLMRRLLIISKKSGNFVIVTTRSSCIANIMGTRAQHMVELKQLPYMECWSIIKEKVTENEGKSIITHELETIGIEIAKKCGGVPLAAKVVGGVLGCHKNKDAWSSIRSSNVWEDVDEDKGILPVLKLSFDHLPPPQKLCFAYCSLFPKDFAFQKEQLIQLWMAEDFLMATSTDGGTSAKSMEDVGEEYFHSLLVNSFFQDAEVDNCGDITRCKMHGLLHDLARSISKTRMLQHGSDCIKTSYGRHLNLACHQVSEVEEILELTQDGATNLRSLFSKVDVSSMVPNFRRLRSLDMSDANLKELPFAIKKLKHLRYLDISRNESIHVLPESITKLYNLLTLRLLECKSLKELPDNMRNLVSLRHIYFDDKRLMPFKVGCLTSLQMLPSFFVGTEEGYKIYELEGLDELRGEMVVHNLEHVRDDGEAKRAKLKEKKLSKLVLKWMGFEDNECEDISSSGECNHEVVLESLEAPPSAKSLTIECYMGKQFPQWMSELNKLVNLEMKYCRRCEKMPTLGHLPCLKVLEVEGMDNMKFIGSEFSRESNNMDTLFPVLEELSISKMKSLVQWATPVRSEIFPKLRRSYIRDCPCLTSIPLSQSTSSAIGMQIQTSDVGEGLVEISCFLHLKSLEDMVILGCPKLTFLHVGLTSIRSFNFIPRGSLPWKQGDFVKNLSPLPSELDGCLKAMKIVGAVEIFREFPKTLEGLEIRKINNLSAEALHGLSNLKHLKIEKCGSISTLLSLTSLKHLEISRCDSVESIPTLSFLTSLQILKIDHCRKLSDLSADSFSTLSCLEELHIQGCNKLSRIPAGIKFCQSLKEFVIGSCPKLSDLSPTSFSAFTRLERLCISRCFNVTSLPAEMKLCSSIEELTVKYCVGLVDVADDIICSLTQLKRLDLGVFSNELDEFPGLNSIHLLTSLEKVTISGWDKLKSLPHQLQHLPSINELNIERFSGVETLPDWLANLSSLQTLSIEECRNLKNLPTAMQRLSKLTRLAIWACPLLERRCDKDIGPDWSYISHIPFVKINYKIIQHLRSQSSNI